MSDLQFYELKYKNSGRRITIIATTEDIDSLKKNENVESIEKLLSDDINEAHFPIYSVQIIEGQRVLATFNGGIDF